MISTVSSEDEKLFLEGLEDQLALVIDLRKRHHPFHTMNNRNINSEMIWSACMEETGGLGVDIIIDNGVALFQDNDYRIMTNDNYTYPVPSKHEIISALAVGGRWITSKENLQVCLVFHWHLIDQIIVDKFSYSGINLYLLVKTF